MKKKTKKKIVKYILYLIGLLVINAFAYGMWDKIIQPCFSWICGIIFRIATLGLSSYSDSFYQSVGTEIREDFSIWILTVCICIFFINILYLEFARYLILGSNDRSDESYKPIVGKLFSFTKFLVIVLCSFFLFNMCIISVRYNLINGFHSRFKLAKLVLDEKEEEMILAEFALIQSKEDYSDIINKLNQIIGGKDFLFFLSENKSSNEKESQESKNKKISINPE